MCVKQKRRCLNAVQRDKQIPTKKKFWTLITDCTARRVFHPLLFTLFLVNPSVLFTSSVETTVGE